ncbi:MAG: hypothetical protein D6692_14655, partial [Planctomycetota bacterium]
MRSTIAAILVRTEEVISGDDKRHLLCQRENKIDFSEVLSRRKILLCNLAAPVIGLEAANILGQFLVSELQVAGMSRPPRQGPDFWLYVDEFQNYINSGFEQLLSRGAKYRISLTMANQFTDQLGHLLKAILGNAGALVSFLVGVDSAGTLAKDFGINPNDLTSLPKYRAWAKVDADCFTLQTLPPTKPGRSEGEV